MHFDERDVGDYRIYAGALEAPRGAGYTATMIVERVQGLVGSPREALRDDNLACGHRWETPADALAYALDLAQEAIRNRAHLLAC
jgi:hypothetical protein